MEPLKKIQGIPWYTERTAAFEETHITEAESTHSTEQDYTVGGRTEAPVFLVSAFGILLTWGAMSLYPYTEATPSC